MRDGFEAVTPKRAFAQVFHRLMKRRNRVLYAIALGAAVVVTSHQGRAEVGLQRPGSEVQRLASDGQQPSPPDAQPSPPKTKPKAAPTDKRAAVLKQLAGIEASLVETRYSPYTRVNAARGLYEFDCSGMASWVLRRAAPGAYQRVLRRSSTGRVVARDFYREIAATRPGKPSWAWERVERVEDARPGDVVAWLKPPERRSNITGHVGFVVEAPVASSVIPGGYLLRFTDASRYRHQDDSRTASGRTGFGTGTILLLGDPETGAPVAYGWFGDWSSWLSETPIVIGRPRR